MPRAPAAGKKSVNLLIQQGSPPVDGRRHGECLCGQAPCAVLATPARALVLGVARVLLPRRILRRLAAQLGGRQGPRHQLAGQNSGQTPLLRPAGLHFQEWLP